MLTGDESPILASPPSEIFPDGASLDLHLLNTIKYLFNNWYQASTGIVACGLLDRDKIVFATSLKSQHGWSHAERNAYEKFKAQYGEPSKHAIFITTLSPCFKPSQFRVNDSCVALMTSLGVQRVHFGVLDTSQLHALADYLPKGLLPSVTQNPQLARVCNNLLDIFDSYGSRINTDLLAIKQEMGNELFSPALEVSTQR